MLKRSRSDKAGKRHEWASRVEQAVGCLVGGSVAAKRENGVAPFAVGAMGESGGVALACRLVHDEIVF